MNTNAHNSKLEAMRTTPEGAVIVDLSEHMDRLTNYEDIAHLLTDEQEAKLVDYVKACMDMSYDQISKRYDHWKEADRAHDVYVRPDTTEFREKAVIADTRAIADTVLTYLMAAITGRNPMFQLEGLNRDSRNPSMLLERVLHQQHRRTGQEARIAQQFLDSIRYGFAPTKNIWHPKMTANAMINFDPRRAFPDPRVSWGDWDNMQFMGFVDFCSFHTLSHSGLYPKLDMYPGLRFRQNAPKSGWSAHRNHKEVGRNFSIDPTLASGSDGDNGNHFRLGSARVVDELWVRLSGPEIGVPQIRSINMVVTVMDEDTIIRLSLNPYGDKFPIAIGGLYHDSHKTYSQSLYDMLMPMHDIATWLLRSRIDNVQAAMNNLIFADPTQVMISDLIDRNPHGIVRTMPGVEPGKGVYIADVPDITRGHWNDISAMSDLKQRVAAASDAQQGMPTGDVRTATEIQRLTQLGSQRLGVLARTISAMTIRPQVRMWVENIQDMYSGQGSIRLDPQNTPTQLVDQIDNGYLDFDLHSLKGDVDYLIIDGTLPLEPTRSPETWMNMLQILTNTGLNMEYNMGRIAEEGIRSMGVSDVEQYKISAEQASQGMTPSQQLQIMEKMRGQSAGSGANPEVMPGEDLQRQIEAGNLIPQGAQ